MKRLFIGFVVLAIVVMGGVVVARRQPPPSPPTAKIERPPYDPAAVYKTIRFYEQRARADPLAAIDNAILAGYYLQRCRETGDLADALRAERAARRSLAIRARHNAAAYDQLALSLFTQHRFTEALAAANHSEAAGATVFNVASAQSGSLRAEIYTELGEYDRAEAALRQSESLGTSPNSKAVRARLLDIEGQPEQALQLLRQAQTEADQNIDLPLENLAWFHMRVGDLLAEMGRASEAEQVYREALQVFPHHYRTLIALTRLTAGRGDWQAAVSWGTQAEEVVPAPEVAGLLGDAYTALGQKREAERQFQLVEAIGTLARVQGIVYDRQRALFLADHDRNLDEALALARREMHVRHDVYAYDTLAWTCFKKGSMAEAEVAMQKALARGTQDARMFYHAGRIALARGQRSEAQTYLARALATNPFFWPFDPDQARLLLKQSGRS